MEYGRGNDNKICIFYVIFHFCEIVFKQMVYDTIVWQVTQVCWYDPVTITLTLLDLDHNIQNGD